MNRDSIVSRQILQVTAFLFCVYSVYNTYFLPLITMKESLIIKADLLLEQKKDKELHALLAHEDFSEVAHIIDGLANGKKKIFTMLPPEKQAEVALVLNEDSKRRIFHRLPQDVISRFLHFNNEDDATDILQHLSATRRALILKKMTAKKRAKIEKLLKFGSETAGGLMDLNFILVKPSFSFPEVLEKIRAHLDQNPDMPTVLVVNDAGNLLGFIPERSLLFPSADATVSQETDPLSRVSHKVDRETVMELMSKMRSEVICVIDDHKKVLGVIHLRDLMKVAQAEATEDIYRFAGVDVEEHALDTVFSKVKKRYNWLLVNLITAFCAAFVVSVFQDTITRFAILAVYMPVVAGQGGNAATQALAVVVRGLALGEINWRKALRVVCREAAAGTLNGAITGIFAAVAAILFGAPPILGVILAVAMITNLTVAGFFGALVPFILKRLKIDPAIASSVFVTTTTDVCGFFVFLGLGSMFMG